MLMGAAKEEGGGGEMTSDGNDRLTIPMNAMMTRRPEGGKETSCPPSLPPQASPVMAGGIMEAPL